MEAQLFNSSQQTLIFNINFTRAVFTSISANYFSLLEEAKNFKCTPVNSSIQLNTVIDAYLFSCLLDPDFKDIGVPKPLPSMY